jgi:hypothetical protein
MTSSVIFWMFVSVLEVDDDDVKVEANKQEPRVDVGVAANDTKDILGLELKRVDGRTKERAKQETVLQGPVTTDANNNQQHEEADRLQRRR